MADRSKGYRGTRMILTIIAVLAVLALVGWQMGYFADGTDERKRTDYTVDVVDESGGELIVTDPEDPRIEGLTLPETAMTPARPDTEASPGTE